MIRDEHLFAFFTAASLFTFVWVGNRQLGTYQRELREQPYTRLARFLNAHRSHETCDLSLGSRREYASAVVDRFRAEIKDLWNERSTESSEPKFALLDLGKTKLRISPKTERKVGFDTSAWSWDEAYSLIRRTQTEPEHRENKQRWRDVDSMVKFLLEKDVARQIHGKKFLAPDLTQHQFRPNPDVHRSGPKEFTASINPGDFKAHQQVLANLLEGEWQSGGWKVKIAWSPSAAYTMLTHSDSNRSFVNHRKKTMEIANLSWTKTVAHELGHILGFDDHYYNVWNARNCYYSQESRLADIMSNSEKGALLPRHWELLDQAYPLGKSGPKEAFNYTWGK